MEKKGFLFLVGALDAAVFFLVVLSSLPDLAKIILAVAVLGIGGHYISREAGWESYFGVSLARGKHGFSLIERAARADIGLLRFVSELGAGVGYGLPYSFAVFGGKKRLLLSIVICNLFFTAIFSIGSLPDAAGLRDNPVAVGMAVCGLLGGLALQSVWLLGFGLFRILTVPNATPGAQLLIVGVTVPWEWVFGLAIAATVHEFAHGVLCKAEKMHLKATGVILFGFLPLGAFVEPDEEAFKKIPLEKKRRILAAGPTANLIAFLVFTIALFAFAAISSAPYEEATAIRILSVNSSYPGSSALTPADLVLKADGKSINGLSALSSVISSKKPGEKIVFEMSSGGPSEVFVGKDGKLGITVIPSARPGAEALFLFIGFLFTLISSTAYLNLAIGSINLVPIFITDGGRLVFEELSSALRGKFGEKRGRELADKLSLAASGLALALILGNLLLPSALKFLEGFFPQPFP
jgi:membrane-associated protease RseP (regulator of RpoE activity)